jgi:hypothetical protein
MSIQLAEATRNARLDAIETDLGADPDLELRSGAPPANAAAADTGTLLCALQLPADAFAAAASGSKAKSGTWQGTASGGGGIIGHFRLKTSGGATKVQGTVTVTGGGGDMELDNNDVEDGQTVTITTFTLTDANA